MNEQLLEKVMSCPRLPSLPSVAMKVIELCRTEDVNVKEIAETISNDPALSTKILKTVNTSYYGLSKPVSTISHALVILGLNSVKTLALGFSLVGNVKDSGVDDFDPIVIWRRSLFSAVGTRLVAQKIDLGDPEEAFLCGLLQDLGVIALLQSMEGKYERLLSYIGDEFDQLADFEQEHIEIDHTQVGVALAEKWMLPDNLKAPIEFHEYPDEAPEEYRQLVRAINFGSRAADVCLREDGATVVPAYLQAGREWFEFTDEESSELLDKIGAGTKELAGLFEIPTDEIREPGEVLAQANEVLLELSLKSQQNADALEQENRDLQQQVITDPLTGAANRGCFNEFIKSEFEKAKKNGTHLSMILLDADKFKAVNDTYGHLAGDRVLISLAETLQANTPDELLVARYGGEEFCVVAPGLDRKQAANLAETLRKCIETTAIKAGENLVLTITASMGVASYEPGGILQRPEHLIKASDQAVYAAKSSGRNCVRVFTPKPKADAGNTEAQPVAAGA